MLLNLAVLCVYIYIYIYIYTPSCPYACLQANVCMRTVCQWGIGYSVLTEALLKIQR